MKLWVKCAKEEIEACLEDYKEEIEEKVYNAWRKFAEKSDCSEIKCGFCPFYGELCDRDAMGVEA